MNDTKKGIYFRKDNHSKAHGFNTYGADTQETPKNDQNNEEINRTTNTCNPIGLFFSILLSVSCLSTELLIASYLSDVDFTIKLVLVSFDFILGIIAICGLLLSFKDDSGIKFNFSLKVSIFVLIILLLALVFVSAIHNIVCLSWVGVSISILVLLLTCIRICSLTLESRK
jgi:hypothetical protein